jgi:hypothetical protein
MKKGDIVSVYQHPISMTDFEGYAELIKRLDVSDYGNGTGEHWVCRFGEWQGEIEFKPFQDDPKVRRWIYQPKKK